MTDNKDLIAEAREALGRVNANAFDHDLLFQYRGGVLGRELTLIVRDLADALEAATVRASQAEAELRDVLRVDVPSLKAERDAAVAALERVRAIHVEREHRTLDGAYLGGAVCDGCRRPWPCPTVAALDGAPEPEWEVQYGRRNRETGALHWLTGDPRDDWWHENQDRYEHVKRYTSPPLPVEGESCGD